jgi:type I site-specific restriction endonuclease
MQALLQAIATVQVRIQAHGSIYANSELQTRYGLIDPILRALEWDISNPEEVQVDCTAGSGKADYVLMSQSNPHIVIEAKSLKMMNSNCVSQGSAYCSALGASVLVCTDGETWSIYRAPNFIQSATVNLSRRRYFPDCLLFDSPLQSSEVAQPNSIQHIHYFGSIFSYDTCSVCGKSNGRRTQAPVPDNLSWVLQHGYCENIQRHFRGDR